MLPDRSFQLVLLTVEVNGLELGLRLVDEMKNRQCLTIMCSMIELVMGVLI